jgi:DNA invertase Pin-like site-specific DNA recombinase
MTVVAPFEDSGADRKVIRAAQYVRMSTEHQKYSTENQAEIIGVYAAARGIEIVRTYADEGKSGLNIDGREALQELIADVTSGRADYSMILVYDISRWGRFQDADQGAFYEVTCRRAGVSVHYCAEQFENDGSISSTIIKTVKRAMAGEYSRELSAKVFTGQCRLIRYGFRQGGPAGFGLRRVLVDENRNPKAELSRGEHKSLQTDRVILQPGPPEEVETVRRIYRSFCLQGLKERGIAELLNSEGLLTDQGRAWTRGTVHQVLTNEKYIGNNVYNRVSYKLKTARVINPPDQWVRADGAFEAIVEPDFFEAAQRIINERYRRYTDADLLELLSHLYEDKGWLSGLVIDETENMPSSSVYRTRFGSLIRAYAMIGYSPARDYRYIEINRALRGMHPEVVANTVGEIRAIGGEVEQDPKSDLLRINAEFTASIVIVRCFHTTTGVKRWKIRLDTGLRPDITIAVRMDTDNQAARDHYLLPWIDVGQSPQLKLAEDNGLFLDAYRFDSLEPLFYLSRRHPLRSAA